MKKVCFSIFAHPDDEAFGPSGTLLKMARSGTDVFLICATAGENGINCDDCPDLSTVRLQEWRTAGKLIGAKGMHHLGYRDGELSNILFHKIAADITTYISQTLEEYTADNIEVSFITFDTNGISGHIDHIAMSMITSYIYYQMSATPSPHVAIKELRYFCISNEMIPEPNTDFVFMPEGRSMQYIQITEDISELAEEKRAIMCAHHSQRQDAEYLLQRKETLQKEHYYLAS